MPKVTFAPKSRNFYTTLTNAVENYFVTNNISRNGNWKLYSKTAILISTAVAFYFILLLAPLPALTGIVISSLLGFVLASIGFNVMHDACHGSYSSRKWVNELLSLTLNALGGNSFIWKLKHNIVHHTYTNVDGVDDDIAKSPLMRQCDTQRWVAAHRFQHVYVFLVYAISSFAWIFIMDFTKYFQQKVYTTPIQKMSRKEHMIFWASKVLYILFYIVIPVTLVGWQNWAIGFTCMHIAMGLTLAVVFQLAHVVENTDFAYANAEPVMLENEWAVHQIRTTANFARDNKIISWFVGGLNYQVEHHLFPRVSHVHYPAISHIVKNVCKDFDIPYLEYSTLSAALASHVRTMKKLGERPQVMVA